MFDVTLVYYINFSIIRSHKFANIAKFYKELNVEKLIEPAININVSQMISITYNAYLLDTSVFVFHTKHVLRT